MFARLTFIDILPEHAGKLKKIFAEEIIPVVKKQKGNIGIWLLEPTDAADRYISLTEWISVADADVYQSSGVYMDLVNKMKNSYKSTPVLKAYYVTEGIIAAVS